MKKHEPNPVAFALEAASADEECAIVFFEKARWGATPKCPCCGSSDVYAQMDETGAKREKNYRWRCRACKEKYSVRTGSIFEETRLPMKVWAHTMWRVCASKKGVSALQIKRETQISYKSALYLLHRVRHALDDGGTFEPLGGDGKDVEADETYVGGKPRNRGMRFGNKRGRGTKKTPVFLVVERGGRARFRILDKVTGRNLADAIREDVHPASRLLTDELPHYIKPGAEMYGGHEVTKHRAREYARGDVHSNTAESVFSILKRGMIGTFHSVSKVHLHRYLSEFAFRWNTRGLNDGQRVMAAITSAEGKRLLFRPKSEKEAG